ncbi:uncharacterized protein EDB93DRAFT_1249562 [Suillus bovinus]|uniref:uncharacterized protein n=1 Tax=Suillus bovinus TaxID=48563 RepID=UPI001B8605AE|nr:uncharacterized protein EDB93DRAFT_1249562 [Suillus bovinus]KAG2151070.1 hypothetical protein EDB93DRAFT_1249562 [Suillus bovinus]
MKHQSRKFIDLIQAITSKWANWDPTKPIHVGDYGMINKKTGEFDCEGNIYTTKDIVDIDMTDPALRPVETGEDDKFIVTSWGVTTKEFSKTAKVSVPGAENVALKVGFQYDGRKRGAGLAMYKSRHISLPNDERIVRLLKSRSQVLKGKHVVTEVICCAAYAMYMSTNRVERFFRPRQATGGLIWSSETNHGIYREGSDSNTKYMPLYRLNKSGT